MKIDYNGLITMALDTIEAVESYDITAGYPQKIVF